MNDVTIKPVCHQCGRAAKKDRLPPGWKRHREVWCDKCWRGAWSLRAVTIPVAGPSEGSWDELRAVLKSCWQDSTRVANWAVTELAKLELPRNGEAKMPAMPRPYLYPGARSLAPSMDPSSVTSLLRAVEARYSARRHHAIWLRRESLPSYRYPMPYPIHNQAWSLERDEGGALHVSARLGGARRRLRLRGGHEFARQTAQLAELLRDEHPTGELAIYQRPASSGDHRPNGVGRQPSRLLVKMCAWFPRRRRADRSGVLAVRTAGDAFWIYTVAGGEPRRYCADQVRRWVAEHRRRLDRLSDDTKHEKRWPARVRRGMAERRQSWCAQQHRRLDSWTHEATAMLAGFAARNNVARVEYDDTDRSFCESLPWATLRGKLADKLSHEGIELVTSGEVIRDGPAPLEVVD